MRTATREKPTNGGSGKISGAIGRRFMYRGKGVSTQISEKQECAGHVPTAVVRSTTGRRKRESANVYCWRQFSCARFDVRNVTRVSCGGLSARSLISNARCGRVSSCGIFPRSFRRNGRSREQHIQTFTDDMLCQDRIALTPVR